MEQLNQVELRGIIGSIKSQVLNSTITARMTVLTNFAYKDNEACAIIDSSWHNVVAWEGKDIQGLSDIQRGDKVYVKGRLRYSKFTGSDGAERIATEIVANRIDKIAGDEPLEYQM